MKVSVIDVGFNSLKMVKYRIEPSGIVTAYGQLGVMARLGEGLAQTGFLGREQITRTIDALKLCCEAASLDAIKHILVVGTSPVREAANRDEFLRLVHEETGLTMRVLTGNEEALYGSLGTSRSVSSPTALFFDLGGGSLQMVYTDNYRVRRILSLPLGALRLTSLFAGRAGTFSRKDRTKMGKRISQMLPSRRELGLDRNTVLVGTGGTVRAMARFDQEQLEYPLNKVHNYQIEYESVQQMSRDFLRLSLEELGAIDSIGGDRSQTITAGALVVRLLMKRLDFSTLTVSTHGVRDGILLEFLERGQPTSVVTQKDGWESLLTAASVSPEFLGTDALAGCLLRNGIIDERQEAIMKVALRVGRTRDCLDAEPDALFGVLMSADLPMSHKDQLFMAISQVKARRSRTANWLLRRYWSMVSREDAKSVKKMGACLRLMEVLDRSNTQFRVAYSGGIRISITDSRGPFPLELARASALAFSTLIKRPVSIFVSAKEREEQAGILKEAA